jgi:hypothetical protein
MQTQMTLRGHGQLIPVNQLESLNPIALLKETAAAESSLMSEHNKTLAVAKNTLSSQAAEYETLVTENQKMNLALTTYDREAREAEAANQALLKSLTDQKQTLMAMLAQKQAETTEAAAKHAKACDAVRADTSVAVAAAIKSGESSIAAARQAKESLINSYSTQIDSANAELLRLQKEQATQPSSLTAQIKAAETEFVVIHQTIESESALNLVKLRNMNENIALLEAVDKAPNLGKIKKIKDVIGDKALNLRVVQAAIAAPDKENMVTAIMVPWANGY